MATASLEAEVELSSALDLPKALNKERPFEGPRRAHKGRRRLAHNLHLDKLETDFKSVPAVQTKHKELLPHVLALHRFKTCMEEFLKEKAQEFESSINSEGDTSMCFPAALQLAREMSFDVRKLRMLNHLAVLSFIHDTILYVISRPTETQEREELYNDELKNAIATAQLLIRDFKSKLIQTHESDEATEKDIAILQSTLDDACNNVKELKTKGNFDEELVLLCTAARRTCHALGLELDFLDRFDYENFHEDIRDHLSIEQWICNFLREDYKMQTELCEFGSLQHKEVLERIGFRADGDAVNTLLRRASTLKEHLRILDWAEMYVKDQFKYNPVLSGFYPRFPFEHDILEQWLELILAVKQGDNQSYREVNIINLESKESASYTKQDNCSYFPQGLEDETHKVLFHGTDHDSARSILYQGARITQGRKNRDFSSGSGFYLTDNLEHSVDWAFSSTCKPAVLVYRVDRSLLETFSGYSLCGEEKKEKWKDLVGQYRSGKPTKKLRKSLRAYDYIEGPRASSCDSVSPEPKDGTYQMCVISDKLVEALESCLHSALFFDGN